MKIIGYDHHNLYHILEDSDGQKRKVDIMVDGFFPQETDPVSLLGKNIEFERLVPYVELAMNVSKCE